MSEALPEPQSRNWDVNPDREPPESAESMYPAPGFTQEDTEKVHAIWKSEYDANEERKAEARAAAEQATKDIPEDSTDPWAGSTIPTPEEQRLTPKAEAEGQQVTKRSSSKRDKD